MADLPVLDALDQRILGALLEKQRTVPASYPLSLNALKSACNQTTSREPVTHHDDATLEERCRDLKQRGLLRVVWAGKGSRVLKYHQLLEEHLGLDEEAVALLTVLLLRGEQTAGELRTRTERLHPFSDKDAAEAALRSLATAQPPLVRELDRRPGEKDRRWVHLLGPVPTADAAPAALVDRESVLAEGPQARDAKVIAAYDTIAATYAGDPSSEVRHPFEAWLLDEVPGLAEDYPVADLGCGPGHVAARLVDAGAEVVAFDPSPAMVAAARAAHPDLEVQQASLAQLMRPRTAEAWGVVVAWYSLIHLAASELPDALAALARTVRVGGWVLVALHAGEGVVHADEWLGHPVDLDVVLHDRRHVVAAAESAGLTVLESYTRGALRPPHGTEQFDRLYVLARRDA